MPIKTNLWKIGDEPIRLLESTLKSERQLEEMIDREPRLLSDEWMLIGRQVKTEFGGIVDLLALAPDGALVLIELKRNRTPRDVVAQSLDYASWLETLQPAQIAGIYDRYRPGCDLAEDFRTKFGQELDEDDLNQSHQIIIVAAELDTSTERIVAYLNDRDIAINVLLFQVFENDQDQFLSRTWLLDPVDTQTAVVKSKVRDSEPWNGEFYCSFGESESRSWLEAVEHGFICGGGGAWYSRTLQLLSPGDRVWVNVPKTGFVGVGLVLGKAQKASEFLLETPEGEKPALEVLSKASYHREHLDDEEKCEYFVSVKWLETKPLKSAIKEVGMFGNQNTVCKPTSQKWRHTVDRLRVQFPDFAKST